MTPPRTSDDLDPLLGDYFHAQRPTPWPPAYPGADRGVTHVALRGNSGAAAGVRPARFSSAVRSRLTLALSAGLVLIGGLALTPPRQPSPSQTAGTPTTSLMTGSQAGGKNTLRDLHIPPKPRR